MTLHDYSLCKTLPLSVHFVCRPPGSDGELRQQISIRIAQHSTGLQITSWFSEQVDDLLNQLWNGILTEIPGRVSRGIILRNCPDCCGRTGRGDLALFGYRFADCAWTAEVRGGMNLPHSL